MTPMSPLPLRCLSIDVEEYYHIEAAHGLVRRDQWDQHPSRAQRNVDLLLTLFDRHKIKATFFFLGDVARRLPSLAPQVAAAGHEIASHGQGHDRLHRLTPQSFREDLKASKQLLEDQIGRAVLGYRAPTFSVVPATAWAIDVLAETDLQYDASVFPVRHPLYGVPQAPDRPYQIRAGGQGATLLEIPPLTWRVAGKNLPVAGGGYFRLFPLALMKQGLRQAAVQGRPAVLYFHPWEFDPDMPRLPLSFTGRIRTYTGLARSEGKLSTILAQRARWLPIAAALPEMRRLAGEQPPFVLA